jgi:hypothetical protein
MSHLTQRKLSVISWLLILLYTLYNEFDNIPKYTDKSPDTYTLIVHTDLEETPRKNISCALLLRYCWDAAVLQRVLLRHR